ncbi:EAL domain-containing protein [Fusibacter bizertensis]
MHYLQKHTFKLSTKLWIWTMGLVISAVIITGLISYNRAVYELNQKNEIILKNAATMAIQILKLQEKDVISQESNLQVEQEDAIDILNKNEDIELGLNGYFVILDSKGNYIYHPKLTGTNGYDYRDANNNYFVRNAIDIAKAGGGFTYYNWTNDLTGAPDAKMSYTVYFEPWDWIVGTSTYLSDYNQVISSMLNEMIKTVILIIILTFFIIQIFVTDIIIPINETVSAMDDVKKGKFSLLINNDRRDELGKLVSGYNSMVKSIQTSQESLLTHNEELEEANKEIQELYEEMLASEEMLRCNYDELERFKKELEEEKENYRRILMASNETYWRYDVADKLMTITNFSRDGMTYQIDVAQFMTTVFFEDKTALTNLLKVEGQMSSDMFDLRIRLLIDEEEGVYHWYKMIGIRESQFVFGSLTDIHQEVINRERIEFYAFHDPVLGLYNMDFLNEIVKNTISKNIDHTQYVLLVVGVVGYARILNAYGKNITDIMSFQLSAEISNIFEMSEYISILHSGRFAIWMKCTETKDFALNQIATLDRAILERVGKFSNIEMPINIAYGATLIDGSPRESSSAISEAETAFEYAVSKGILHEIQWYDASLKVKKERSLALEQRLFKSLEHGELFVVYQPQYQSLSKKDVIGYEALLRWENEEMGNINPDEFIPIAENVDFINSLGRFVIEESIKFICLRKAAGDHISVSINASYKELLQNDYVTFLMEKINDYDISVNQIHIEITETTISEYIDIVREKLDELVAHGFEVHMDDFGTGYSSLYQLGRMPVEVLKIDKSFVWALATDEKMNALTKLIIDLAHRMNMKIIAEGVETVEQYEILSGMGCDYYQGYLLSKPLAVSEIN